MANKQEQNSGVLIFSQNPNTRNMLDSLFDISGLSSTVAENTEDFMRLLEEAPPDVIILATELPELTGFELCDILKHINSPYRDIPLVFVFPPDTPVEVTLHGIQLGAYDYLVEPFNEIELITKVSVLTKIKRAEDEFRKMAIKDKVTGLYDQRYLFIRFNEELSRAKRYSRPISCLIADVDDFASFNQQYGSESGDFLLRSVADAMQHCKREIDVLARNGSDSFVFVLYNTDSTGATVLANRLLNRLSELELPMAGGYSIRVSIGLTSLEAGPENSIHAQELQQQSELAVRRAKRDGGHQIVVYSEELAADILPTEK